MVYFISHEEFFYSNFIESDRSHEHISPFMSFPPLQQNLYFSKKNLTKKKKKKMQYMYKQKMQIFNKGTFPFTLSHTIPTLNDPILSEQSRLLTIAFYLNNPNF